MSPLRYQLGRHVEHDPRSRNFAYRVAAARPHTRLWDHHGPVLDQGDIGACTGFALAQWANTAVAQQDPAGPARWLDGADALDLYSRATHLDGIDGVYPPTDTGSSGLAACKAGVRRGLLDRYEHVFSFDGLLMALQHTPVIAGTSWTESMFAPRGTMNALTITGEPIGGHEYLILGADFDTGYITILNSWGPEWGENGRARIHFTDYSLLLHYHGDVTVPIIRNGLCT